MCPEDLGVESAFRAGLHVVIMQRTARFTGPWTRDTTPLEEKWSDLSHPTKRKAERANVERGFVGRNGILWQFFRERFSSERDVKESERGKKRGGGIQKSPRPGHLEAAGNHNRELAYA
jgi:hypothetical protein